MIRTATVQDLPAMLDLGQLLHESSSYARYSFDRDKVAAVLMRAMKEGGLFVATAKGLVVGGIAGGIAEFWFGRDVHGFDYSFFVHPEHRHGITAFKLLLAFEAWCKSRGATEIRIGITTGIDVESTTRFYEWHGYAKNGALFTKGI